MIPIELLLLNEGQIPGLPKNPRFIKDGKYRKLVQSIVDDPEMLDLRECIVYPFGKKFVTIGGNVRLRGCRELKKTHVPCKVLPVDTPPEKLRAYAIKDNGSFGEDDTELLANEWKQDELIAWGVDVAEWNSPETPNLDGFFKDHTPGDKGEATEKLVLEYTKSDHELVVEALKHHEGTKEQVVFKLLGLA